MRRSYSRARPTRAEATAFLEDSTPDKRATLIDQLLARPEYGGYWARLWRDRVAVPIGAGEDLKGQYTANFQKWFAEEFNKNRPWDELVRAMISAESEDAPVAFIRQCMDDGQPRANKLAASAARRFLGIQLQCAECHDHPFATWTQVEFWGLAAFFSRTAIGKTDDKAAEVIDRPVSGPDFMATVLKLLGIDPHLELQAGNRPVRAAAPGGKPVEEITG